MIFYVKTKISLKKYRRILKTGIDDRFIVCGIKANK